MSIFDSALMFGDMAFEMTRTFQGKPFKLREHLQRLYASLRLLDSKALASRASPSRAWKGEEPGAVEDAVAVIGCSRLSR